MTRIRPYVAIARLDHWFKNAFMVLGVVVAILFRPEHATWAAVPDICLAVLATCLVASANYVLNEILDAPTDRQHPVKSLRPYLGLVRIPAAVLEWILLAAVGIGIGFWINVPFGITAVALWVAGTLYNVPPIRTKELPYIDVITESINNPLRLFLGWFALIPTALPPMSLVVSYWALGAFFMATKRFAELRMIGDVRAAEYRRSFAHYTENNLLVSMFFYIASCSFLGGVFILRNKLELILSVPLIAGVFAYYLLLGLRENSPVQNPERLHRERGFFAFTLLTFSVFIALMFTRIPVLYDIILSDPPKTPQLWTLGG